MKTRSVQAVPGRCVQRGFGFPPVGVDPRHDRLGVSTCGDDRGPLDDHAAGGMSSGQPGEQRPNRVVVHAFNGSRYPGIECERGGMRFTVHVPDEVELKIQLEVESDDLELEIELTW